MKKYLLSAAAALLLFSYASTAQQNETLKAPNESNPDNKKNKLKEYDEIIIKRKDPNKDAKVVIEIKDDQVIVDGKPLDQFIDDEVSVRMRNANRYKLRAAPSPFRTEDEFWSQDQQDMLDSHLDMLEQRDLFGKRGEEKPYLGVSTEGTTGGTRIVNVSANSAAAKAGLQKDDIITKINDKEVFDQEQLSEVISGFKPDEKITITYKRNGKENKTTAILGKRPMPPIVRAPGVPMSPGHPMPPVPPMVFNFDEGELGDLFQQHQFGGRPRLGIKAQDTEEGKGVKVLDVDEGSAADKAGIKENDIITSFEGKDVNSAEELAKASSEAKDKTSLKVELKRNGKPQTIEIKVPKKLKTANL
jgi:serine protease Do